MGFALTGTHEPALETEMNNNVTHMILDALNSSEAHIGYALWFYAPDLVSMLLFFIAALAATIHLMPLGRKN